jgi:hypothetical protein
MRRLVCGLLAFGLVLLSSPLALASKQQTHASKQQAHASNPAPEAYRLRVLTVRGLFLPGAFQGDGPQAISPHEGDEHAALFVITGRPFLTVSVLLPEESVELFTISFESGPKKIRVRDLLSQPAAGESFHLGLLGLKKVYVGGVREAIARNQASGPYLGRFFLTVVHQ